MSVRALHLLAAAVVSTSTAVAAAQQPDLDRGLDEARALYGEAKFPEAVARLDAFVSRLESLPDYPKRDEQLVEAYLLLGLAHVALDDLPSARASFKRALRVRPGRRLDPEVYAPKVVTLFEEARAEAAKEAAQAPQAGSSQTPLDRQPQLLPGTRIRVSAAGASRKLEGRLVAIDDAAITLDADYRGTMKIPRATVKRLDASIGRRSRAREGALVGAAIAVVNLISDCSSGSCSDAAGPAILIVGFGALVGRPFKTYDWRQVPLDQVRTVCHERPPVRLSASFSFRF
jgi:tetratricopeptide (TPR) repeat protein